MTPKIVPFLNGSAQNMNVLGTILSPIEFIITPPSKSVWYVHKIQFLLQAPSTILLSTFGSIPLLTNGCKLIVQTDASSEEIGTFYSTQDLMLGFTTNMALGLPTVLTGEMVFPEPLILSGESGSKLYWKISDILTTLTVFKSSAIGYIIR